MSSSLLWCCLFFIFLQIVILELALSEVKGLINNGLTVHFVMTDNDIIRPSSNVESLMCRIK